MDSLKEIYHLASQIQMIVFDVDGVFTDGRIWLDHQGEEIKVFHVHDGHGIKMAIHYGVKVAVLSARKSDAVTIRMRALGIKDILQGHIDKRSAFKELIADKNIDPAKVAYVGDDIVDLQVMTMVGLPIAVANAQAVVKNHVKHVTSCSGGQGAVREVCDLVLDAKGLLDEAIEYNL
jgi:3-deoxy-D-manno-octulosonate 8-phosphate phosphatase (KDO 8-P phosphatase)